VNTLHKGDGGGDDDDDDNNNNKVLPTAKDFDARNKNI
jgi:hypothetical protein